MADNSVREPLTVETTTCKPTCKRPINGTAIKFTFVCMVFQFSLIVMFMVLVDYGEDSLPSLVADRPTVGNNKSGTAAKNEKNEQAHNDISVYYPSKCFY